MTNILTVARRVAAEADPPAELGRLHYGDYDLEIMLDDLVSTKARLNRDLKERFLAIWIGDPEFDDPSLSDEDPYYERTRDNLEAFAAIEPVVDLNSLRDRDPLTA